MKLKYLSVLVLVPLLLSCSKSDQVHAPLALAYFEMIDTEFNSDQAFNTVAYIEKYFRVVGNEGFNKSIYYVEDLLQDHVFVEESLATPNERLTYRIEHRSLERPTWEPVSVFYPWVQEKHY
jgi:hypothetical protein